MEQNSKAMKIEYIFFFDYLQDEISTAISVGLRIY